MQLQRENAFLKNYGGVVYQPCEAAYSCSPMCIMKATKRFYLQTFKFLFCAFLTFSYILSFFHLSVS